MTLDELNKIFACEPLPKGFKPYTTMIKPTKEFLEVFKKTNGALSVCESIAIMNIAAQAPQGTYIELGTHKGKSAMAACVGLPNGILNLVEPEFNDERWEAETIYDIKNAVSGLGDAEKVIMLYPIAGYSTDVLQNAAERGYCYVFVDSGSHQDGLPLQEVKLLEDAMAYGGIIAFHDFRSQFIEVEGAYNYLLSTGKYEEIPINWNEIIEYVKENDLEKGNTSWHHNELEFPCFVGALKRK